MAFALKSPHLEPSGGGAEDERGICSLERLRRRGGIKGRKQKRYYVDVMASRSRTLYTGLTGDLFHRALQHKKGEIEGFTKEYNIDPS